MRGGHVSKTQPPREHREAFDQTAGLIRHERQISYAKLRTIHVNSRHIATKSCVSWGTTVRRLIGPISNAAVRPAL